MDGTTTTTSGGGDGEQVSQQTSAADEPQMLATAVGDQCANCGARLAGDQRYCLECGERRGRPRYSLPAAAAGAGAGGGTIVSRRRLGPLGPLSGGPDSGSGALIGAIGVLLIAMGVGVLIGRTSNGSSNNGVRVITVAGAGGGAAAATPTTPSTTPTSTPSASSSKSKSKAKATPATTAAVKKNPTAALTAKLPPKAKVIPPKLKSAVVKPGQTCTPGEKGCTNGKFTGTFFGGG